METHALGQVHRRPRRAGVAATTVLQVGALAGIAAGLLYAAWQVVVAAIAQDPTAVPGIHQPLWTPPEGIWSARRRARRFASIRCELAAIPRPRPLRTARRASIPSPPRRTSWTSRTPN